jgi:hypothetical protein
MLGMNRTDDTVGAVRFMVIWREQVRVIFFDSPSPIDELK